MSALIAHVNLIWRYREVFFGLLFSLRQRSNFEQLHAGFV